MYEIFNMFWLAGDKFMPEMHLRKPGFSYGVRGPNTKNKKKLKKHSKRGDLRYIYQNKLEKACFQHDIG